jgi:acyl-CoA synthetase (AMP-forming)/AMP-acid ligase II
MAQTLFELLETGADDAPAIGAPGTADLTYDGLRGLIADTGAALAANGIGPGDRVAIVLPNGPAMATCFLSAATYACAAPLNPAYREQELDFYISDLGAKLLIVGAGMDTAAAEVAKKHGLRVIELEDNSADKAGLFTLLDIDAGAPRATQVEPDTVAMVLHTSGTTSRPKIVPLSQKNLCASAGHIASSLTLGTDDRNLNIMPMFHIHGLIAALLAPLSAGAHVSLTPGFNALKFFAWLDEVKPNWYTAVPTMHQAILSRAKRNQASVERSNLRFIRSSSASLPPQVMLALEDTFGCPVIEAYGMTEAAHQMAANPLPPMTRKPGTVGVAAGPEVSIMDQAGRFVPQGGEGEIVIRGPNVTAGYENNPKANAESFPADPDDEGGQWFRTGDQGIVDQDGYLRITGRIKEIINRGGEKISPREVDEILLDHDAVAQVVTFAMPHDKLGEDVAAAIVLDDGAEVSEAEIKDYAAGRLADFKVPRKIVFLDEIPKGATGKLQRIGLAEKLGLG